ncbi:hypothetical protein XENORESO_021585, partial [Xenotaenia resolanae]
MADAIERVTWLYLVNDRTGTNHNNNAPFPLAHFRRCGSAPLGWGVAEEAARRDAAVWTGGEFGPEFASRNSNGMRTLKHITADRSKVSFRLDLVLHGQRDFLPLDPRQTSDYGQLLSACSLLMQMLVRGKGPSKNVRTKHTINDHGGIVLCVFREMF